MSAESEEVDPTEDEPAVAMVRGVYGAIFADITLSDCVELSIQGTQSLGLFRDGFTYGETSLRTVWQILSQARLESYCCECKKEESVNMRHDDGNATLERCLRCGKHTAGAVIVDLGSGIGNVVVGAALLAASGSLGPACVGAVHGVELLPTLHRAAASALAKLEAAWPSDTRTLAPPRPLSDEQEIAAVAEEDAGDGGSAITRRGERKGKAAGGLALRRTESDGRSHWIWAAAADTQAAAAEEACVLAKAGDAGGGARLPRCTVSCGRCEEYDGFEDCDLVYLASTVFENEVLQAVAERTARCLRVGARVVTLAEPLRHEAFVMERLVHTINSWGDEDAYINLRV
jgi:ribosomal protein L37AE/L43A